MAGRLLLRLSVGGAAVAALLLAMVRRSGPLGNHTIPLPRFRVRINVLILFVAIFAASVGHLASTDVIRFPLAHLRVGLVQDSVVVRGSGIRASLFLRGRRPLLRRVCLLVV